MTYRAIFERVFDRLDELEIDYTYIKTARAEIKDVRRAEKSLGVALPAAFRDFYTGFASSLLISWIGRDQLGGLEVPTFKELGVNVRNFRSVPSEVEDYSFPPPMGEARAREIAGLMKAWLPFQIDGEGNSLCVDSACGAVVYHNHAWFSGRAEIQGHVLAPDFSSFVVQWSRVCFLRPNWWPQAFKDRREGWDVEAFPVEFRL